MDILKRPELGGGGGLLCFQSSFRSVTHSGLAYYPVSVPEFRLPYLT